MGIELIILIGLLALGAYFGAVIFLRFYRKDFMMKVPGYKFGRAQDYFHQNFTKNYPGFRLSFYPLVQSDQLARASFMPQSKNEMNDFKGIVCHLEIVRVERALLDKILLHFDRYEEHDEFSLSLYQEEIDFNTKEMQAFVQKINQEIRSTFLAKKIGRAHV